MTSKKTLLVIGGGDESIPGIHQAKEMGLYVVVSDLNPKAPGFEHADCSIIASTYDIDQTVKKAKEFNRSRKIDGVISFGTDVPLTVFAVANQLKLQSIPKDSAYLVSNKLAMKNKFKADGIPISFFKEIKSIHELKEIVDKYKNPLVLKPIDSRGARGVLRLTKDIDLEWAYNYSKSFSTSQKIMVEEFLEGPQISTESIVYENKVYTLGFADRNYEYMERFSPHIIENGGELPSYLNPEQKKEVLKLVEDSVRSIGIESGVAKGDIVYTEEGPKVIEIAGRLSGGYFCYPEIYLSTGVNIVKASISIALRNEFDIKKLIPKFERGVAQRYIFPNKSGHIKEIIIPESIRNLDYVKLLKMYVKSGDIIESITDHTKRLGVVIVDGKNRDEALDRVLNVVDMINIVIE